MITSTEWIENMAFEQEIDGHKFVIDAKESFGGKNRGPSPKAYMLSALGGCTSIDIVSILKKMRVLDSIASFKVEVSGELTEEHPKHFISMHVKYYFTPKEGIELPMAKLEKAVTLSEEQYCGVSAVYKKSMPVTSEIIIL